MPWFGASLLRMAVVLLGPSSLSLPHVPSWAEDDLFPEVGQGQHTIAFLCDPIFCDDVCHSLTPDLAKRLWPTSDQ